MRGVQDRPHDRQRPFIPAITALITLAWLSLWAWGRSPYGRYLSHHSLEDLPPAGFLMPAFVAGWTVMIVAMMLPTSVPLVMMFHTVAQRVRLVILLIGGYLGVWTAFGALVYLVDWGLHESVERNIWLEANGSSARRSCCWPASISSAR